jgi:hypothetical protein
MGSSAAGGAPRAPVFESPRYALVVIVSAVAALVDSGASSDQALRTKYTISTMSRMITKSPISP